MTTLEVLVAVADHGSLSAGARHIGVAQPNASRSISRLERRLGFALLVRSTRGAAVTPKGLVVVEWARDVLSAAEVLMQGAERLVSNEQNLRVVASQTVAEHLLPRWIAELRVQQDVQVDIRVVNSEKAAEEVFAGHAQLGFVESPEVPGGMHHAVVTHDELVTVVPPGHDWADRAEAVALEEFAATPLVMREAGSGTRTTLDRALGERGPAVPLLELGSNAAVRVAVLSGAGPTVISRLAVGDLLAQGALVEVPVEGLRLKRVLRAIWSGPRALGHPAADLVVVSQAPST